MTLVDWLFSSYPNPHIDNQWGFLHILTLALCIGLIVTLSIIFRHKSDKAKRIVLIIIASVLLLFEIARRVINFIKTDDYSFTNILSILLFRPMCAIASFSVMLAIIFNRKWFYSFASICGLMATIIFFAYPGVGFNNQFILFENFYSIMTHALIFVLAIMFITFGFANFNYKEIWKTYICWGVMVTYALFENFVLTIESDAMYFMPNNDVMEIIGLQNYAPYLIIYIVFTNVFINAYYLIKMLSKKKQKSAV